MKKNRIFIVLLAALLLLSFAVSVWAAAPPKPKGYPERPIEAVVQYGAGGGTDIFVRTLMNAARKDLGVAVNVTNITGASGVKASNYVLEQPADGYTIYSFAPEQIINTVFGRENYRDFMPLCNVQQDETVFYVRAESPYKTIHDVLNAAKQNPGKIRMAGAMSASPDEVIAMLFAKKAGIQINYIPFDKAPESHAAVLGGHLEVLYEEPGVIMSLIEAGKLRPLLDSHGDASGPLAQCPHGQGNRYRYHHGAVAGSGREEGDFSGDRQLARRHAQEGVERPVLQGYGPQIPPGSSPGLEGSRGVREVLG